MAPNWKSEAKVLEGRVEEKTLRSRDVANAKISGLPSMAKIAAIVSRDFR